MTPQRQAFTLIELSIALVVIGLIVGGILVGQDLIYAAKVRKMMGEVESYKTAVNTFRLKYDCIPGDCKNAYVFFGTDCGTDNSSMVLGGCNGNGDNFIGLLSASIFQSLTENEAFKFWTHLNLAGFGPKTTGLTASNPIFQVGVNSPVSPFPIAGYTPSGKFIVLGANNPTNVKYHNHNPVFTTKQAYAIEQKYDDGHPYSGKIWIGNGYGGYGTYPCNNSGTLNLIPIPYLTSSL